MSTDVQFTQPGPGGQPVLYELRTERGEKRLYAYHPAGLWHPVSTSEAVQVLGVEVAARVAAGPVQEAAGGR